MKSYIVQGPSLSYGLMRFCSVAIDLQLSDLSSAVSAASKSSERLLVMPGIEPEAAG